MNLVQLASHTVDLDLLPEALTVLDVGCRWFDFTRAVREVRPGAAIVCMDPATDVWDATRDHEKAFPARLSRRLEAALVGRGNSAQMLAHFSTGEGDFIGPKRYMPGWDIQPEWYDVECFTLGEVMLLENVQHFDLIKLDCEGSEFDILEHFPGPVATQISVEFHDWDKPMYRSEAYYERLWKALPWYRVVQHEFSKQGTGVGHWDSLLVLR